MLRRLISYTTGYRYNYRVELTYQDKYNKTLFSINMTLRLTSPKYFDSFREIKKVIAPDLVRYMPKHLLKNGNIRLEPVMYLGYIKGN
jgi:hypothetical protein